MPDIAMARRLAPTSSAIHRDDGTPGRGVAGETLGDFHGTRRNAGTVRLDICTPQCFHECAEIGMTIFLHVRSGHGASMLLKPITSCFRAEPSGECSRAGVRLYNRCPSRFTTIMLMRMPTEMSRQLFGGILTVFSARFCPIRLSS